MEAKRFLLCAITSPEAVTDEVAKIEALIDAGFDWVHLRKPGLDAAQNAMLIAQLAPSYRSRIRLHDHYELADCYALGGVQLNGRNPIPAEIRLSDKGAETPRVWATKSCHTPEEVLQCHGLAYATLSPVYSSISKPGYKSEQRLLPPPEATVPVVALGGVTPDSFRQLRNEGFAGAALLGAIAWQLPLEAFGEHVRRIVAARPPLLTMPGGLQLITDGTTADALITQVREAVNAGCRWVQLRMKTASDDEVARVAHAILPLCREQGATLLVDDRVALARELGLDGVHLGKEDMAPQEARRILGEQAIIGATANTLEDVVRLSRQPIDYFGIGPFRFTTTKQRLAPTLGLEGYRALIQTMHEQAIRIPVVAIGGITVADVASLMQTGIDGIAISGAIVHAPDIAEATRSFLTNLVPNPSPFR